MAPDYRLLPLAELGQFIERERHLPNVPSAADFQQQGGVNVTDLQMRLLEKIEELMLYTLEQQEEINRLRSQVTAILKSSGAVGAEAAVCVPRLGMKDSPD